MAQRGSLAVLALAVLPGCSDEGEPGVRSCPPLLPHWSLATDGRSAFRPRVIIAFNGSGVTWNGVRTSRAAVRRYLQQTRLSNPLPHIIFDPSAAPSCEAATHIRDEIDQAANCKDEGICGQGRADDWKKARIVD